MIASNLTFFLHCVQQANITLLPSIQEDMLFSYIQHSNQSQLYQGMNEVARCAESHIPSIDYNIASYADYSVNVDYGFHEPIDCDPSFFDGVGNVTWGDPEDVKLARKALEQIPDPHVLDKRADIHSVNFVATQHSSTECKNDKPGRICKGINSETCNNFNGRNGPAVLFENNGNFAADFMWWLHHTCSYQGGSNSKDANGQRAHIGKKTARCFKNRILSFWIKSGSSSTPWVSNHAPRDTIKPQYQCNQGKPF